MDQEQFENTMNQLKASIAAKEENIQKALEEIEKIKQNPTQKYVFTHMPKQEINERVKWAASILNIEELLNRKDIYIKSYLPQDENLMNRIEQIIIELNEIEIRMDMGPTRVTYKPVQEEDWANAWKVYFKPERIGKKTVIKPSWEEYTAQEGDLIIEIDPGMAFGTGTHHTTNMCMARLEKILTKDDVVFDVGTGSGILAGYGHH